MKKHFKEIQVKMKVQAKDFRFFFLILFLGCAGSSLPLGLSSSCGKRELFSSCGARSYAASSPAVEHGLLRAWASLLPHTGLVAPWPP